MDPLTLGLLAIGAFIYWQKSTLSGVITGVSTVTKAIGKAAVFVATQYGNAKQLQDETGIDPLITLLQAAHESNFGTSGLAVQYHNLFGIKPSQAWLKAGKPLAHFTNVASENGADADFRAYPSDIASMEDWATFLQTNYPLAYSAAQQGDTDLFFDGLLKGKYGAYATDPNYKTSALALLPSITGSLPTGTA
jgi:flagellum-specific peptidoglycan hydrolase FlgJ